MKNVERVQVFVKISGDYCAFHEISMRVAYDITNDISLSGDTKEELENWDFDEHGGGYSDVEEKSAIKMGDEYYVLL